MANIYSSFTLGDMALDYLVDEEGHMGLRLIPADMKGELSEKEHCELEPLVQLHIAGDAYAGRFSQGRTLRGAGDVFAFKPVSQRREGAAIVTVLKDGRGLQIEHRVAREGDMLTLSSGITNCTDAPVSLEMLSSFTLGGLTPFCEGDGHGRLEITRLLSTWSCEGKVLRQPIEDLQLEPSWSCYSANTLRFGQVGSMPVNGFVPMAGITDTQAGVTWVAELAQPLSWQFELYRTDFGLSFSGGLADRELGHFMKTLAPGEKFTTPDALLTCARGEFDAVCQRIVNSLTPLYPAPTAEKGMPVLFNEYCTTWGKPTGETICKLAQKLKGHGMKYLVIDAGWYAKRLGEWGRYAGDWLPCDEMYPDGFDAMLDGIRAAGMIPGIWFEFEVTEDGARLFTDDDLMLKRDGVPLMSGDRRFLDFTNPDVRAYLHERVIEFLRAHGFGYMKIDYNDSIGMGADGCESQGEKLRRHICAVEDFLDEIRRELPELTLEICSSGGHRMVPDLLRRCSMVSFSDAHECPEIPLVAKNIQRFVKPAQSQIWAVVRPEFELKRIYYRMTGGMLGRLCVSGGVHELSAAQWRVVDDGVAFYGQISGIIESGVSEFLGNDVKSTRHPDGWQAVVRRGANGDVLVVAHTFERAPREIALSLPGMKIAALYARAGICATLTGGALMLSGLEDFDGVAIKLCAE